MKQNFKLALARFLSPIAKIPWKFMFGLILVSLLLKEWYPISYFPMYSVFQGATDYVYLTDIEEQPIPLETEFGIRTAFLYKVYRTRVKNLEKEMPQSEKYSFKLEKEIAQKAGNEVLQYLINERNPKTTSPTEYEGLELWLVRVRVRDNQIIYRKRMVAEIGVL